MNLINRNCCICNSDNSETIYEQSIGPILGIGDLEYIHTIVICKECGFVYASPILNEHIISEYYASLSNYENPQNNGENSSEDKNKFNRAHDFIINEFPKNYLGKVLDIGCSVAYGLYLFKKKGWNTTGLDPSPKCAEISKNLYGINVITGTFNKKKLIKEGTFDVIILSHVLEHLVSPELIITDLLDLLTENGVVYVEVPNLLRPYVPMGYFVFEHLNYFTPKSLNSLMVSNGFVVSKLNNFDNSADIAPFYPIIASTWKKSTQQNILIKNDYKEALAVVNEYSKTSSRVVETLKERIELIIKKHKEGRIALWGAGIHTSLLLSMTKLSKIQLVCVFDNDPKKHNKLINNIKVVPLDRQPEQVKKRVDAIIISSKASEDAIYNQIAYLLNYGIEIYRLYNC